MAVAVVGKLPVRCSNHWRLDDCKNEQDNVIANTDRRGAFVDWVPGLQLGQWTHWSSITGLRPVLGEVRTTLRDNDTSIEVSLSKTPILLKTNAYFKEPPISSHTSFDVPVLVRKNKPTHHKIKLRAYGWSTALDDFFPRKEKARLIYIIGFLTGGLPASATRFIQQNLLAHTSGGDWNYSPRTHCTD